MSPAVVRFFPWIGPDNRLSPLKLGVFAALFLPGLWVAFQFDQGMLGPRALNQAIHEIGLWTIRLLLLSLAITPLRQILRWPALTLTRRMIGVAAFAYGAIHLLLYIADEKFNLAKVVTEIYLRIYLTIGFTALLALMVLAITSTDGMIARLGGKTWQRLHRLIYAIVLLGIVHFYMQAKSDVWQPMWMAGLFAWLMFYRFWPWRRASRGAPSLGAMAGLAIAAASFTVLGEALYYWVTMRIDPLLVIGANFSAMAGVRPSWIVLAGGAAMLLLGAAGAWRARRQSLQRRRGADLSILMSRAADN